MIPDVEERFSHYPESIKPYLERLRALIFQQATDLELGDVEEALKWGEPSYCVKSGSPIRLDWKPKTPNCYYLYFHCQTKLVDTFRELYAEELEFQGNRAIVLSADVHFPEKQIKHCIELALTYKKIKHLPLLGA